MTRKRKKSHCHCDFGEKNLTITSNTLLSPPLNNLPRKKKRTEDHTPLIPSSQQPSHVLEEKKNNQPKPHQHPQLPPPFSFKTAQ